jgi:ATP-binding cassette, subfamily F, member 3
VLTLTDIAKAYGPKELFSDVSLTIQRRDRLGLVGANGAGKSTLFRIILGEEEADQGAAQWERGADFGFLPQESAPVGEETILEIATAGTRHDPDDPFPEVDWSLEPRAKKILSGLGFREADFDLPARTFSGGWVMRAHIARLLVCEPTLLLLDEPTNHLDLEALLWFQDHLTRYPGGLVVISHDRAFLNALCNGMLELRGGRLHRYTGNYDDFLVERVARREQQEAAFRNRRREIAHLQTFVDRFGAKASMASRAKSKEKQIERLEADAPEEPEEDLKRIHFRFPQPPRSSLRVMRLQGVRQAYGDHVVYRDLNLELERGQRTVLVGPNGAGKSTLLKILAGQVPVQGGTIETGTQVQVGYFAQNRLDNLDAGLSVLENVLERRSSEFPFTEEQARSVLGAFLFRKDDVHKPVKVLSGGEKSRLALVRMLMRPPNLLLMDEPTTHLDMPSIDALIHALGAYEGTLVFISHDVHFIRNVAGNVLHVHSGRLTPYAGGYDYYLEKSRAKGEREALTAGFTDARPAQAAPAPAAPAKPAKVDPGVVRRLRREVTDLESRVGALEREQAEATAALQDPATYADPAKAPALNRRLAALGPELEAATAAWAEKAAELERLAPSKQA